MRKSWANKLAILACSLSLISGCRGRLLSRAVSQKAHVDRLTATQLAVIVNQSDPLSQQIADYYQARRNIPAANMIRVRFDPKRTVLPINEFQTLLREVQRQTPDAVKAYALTWAQPYRVGCMSVTSAFALGFNEDYCASACAPTAVSPYFNRKPSSPIDQNKIRPTMALAADNIDDAKALIDRGVAADGSRPPGTAYLMNTSDPNRNVRSPLYAQIQSKLGDFFSIQIIESNQLRDRRDVMFYFTGLAQVEAIDTNQYRPGAVADHLTSFGGELTDSGQMSSLDWLKAGTTGSYGTVVEPCNFPQKFPHPGVLIVHYLNGDTLIESYWKSVLMPGQGIFIGEPLARPFSD